MNFLLKTILPLLIFLSATTAHAQEEPVNWSVMVEQSADRIFTVTFTGRIDAGWHIYDTGDYGTFGPTATSVAIDYPDGVKPYGPLKCLSEVSKEFDRNFDMEIGTIYRLAVLEQQIEVTEIQAPLKAVVSWQACTEQSCTAPSEVELSITIPRPESLSEAQPEKQSTESAIPVAEEAKSTTETIQSEADKTQTPDAQSSSNMWLLILEAILWGFAALLTPCVFPMVPMTVSFFLKGSKSAARGRLNALLYGVFIIALYTVPIGIIIAITRVIGGDAVTADIFNWISTHWLPNIIFFVVFMVFAASFFGAFEIVMPSSLVNSSDEKADKGGIAGVFFMALTLVLVSFSCTGPIVGSVLIKSTAGQFWEPIVTMLAFSAAFSLPFTLFAFFPTWLKKLPKSGGWLNSVKVVLGFIEVALGLKFLSVADQVYHWRLLDREVYLAIWIAVFTLLAMYLLGKIRFKHDDAVEHIGVRRLTLAIITLSFVVYLIPGMFGAPLKALSGYLPPLSTQDFIMGANSIPSTANEGAAHRKYSDVLHLPHGLEGFFDLEEAVEYAERQNKPVFIDFTGHGCVNCREMEANVWSDPRVLELLSKEYVICALYTDDKMELPSKDWVTTPEGKVLKTLGKINANYAITRFNVNAQPYYVLQGKRGEILTEPRGYDKDIEAFIAFLQRGLEAFRKANN